MALPGRHEQGPASKGPLTVGLLCPRHHRLAHDARYVLTTHADNSVAFVRRIVARLGAMPSSGGVATPCRFIRRYIVARCTPNRATAAPSSFRKRAEPASCLPAPRPPIARASENVTEGWPPFGWILPGRQDRHGTEPTPRERPSGRRPLPPASEDGYRGTRGHRRRHGSVRPFGVEGRVGPDAAGPGWGVARKVRRAREDGRCGGHRLADVDRCGANRGQLAIWK